MLMLKFEFLGLIYVTCLFLHRVHLVGSVPGRHMGEKKSAYGHLKLKKVTFIYKNHLDNCYTCMHIYNINEQIII